jgi:transitional endoplasmic reticulum ATPase
VSQRILSQLLREIDSLRDVKGVILLAATNRPERIEPALLRSGRFDYILPFAKPDAADRAAIMRLCCGRVPIASDVDFVAFAEGMEGSTGADIESLCKKAALLAIVEFRDHARMPFAVRRSDFLAVLESDSGNLRQAQIAEELINRAGDLRPGASPTKEEGGS